MQYSDVMISLVITIFYVTVGQKVHLKLMTLSFISDLQYITYLGINMNKYRSNHISFQMP